MAKQTSLGTAGVVQGRNNKKDLRNATAQRCRSEVMTALFETMVQACWCKFVEFQSKKTVLERQRASSRNGFFKKIVFDFNGYLLI